MTLQLKSNYSVPIADRACYKVACPVCGTGMTIDPRNTNAHACGGYCGHKWQCGLPPGSEELVLTPKEERDIPGLTLLALDVPLEQDDKFVYFIVRDTVYAHSASSTNEEIFHNKEFFINTSTCPTNLVRVTGIIESSPTKDDVDPHGIFTFVSFVSFQAIKRLKGFTAYQELDTYMNNDGVSEDWRAIFLPAKVLLE